MNAKKVDGKSRARAEALADPDHKNYCAACETEFFVGLEPGRTIEAKFCPFCGEGEVEAV